MKTKAQAIRFSESEKALIDNYARQNGLTFSEVVRQAAQTFVTNTDDGRLSLSTLASRASEEDPHLLYGQFLDDFSRASDKSSLIDKEPQWEGSNAAFWLCTLAATAHKLAHDNSLPVPRWVLSERYVATEPIYGMNTTNPDFKAYLEKTSPMEFRYHNIFLGNNALTRV